MTIVKLAVAVCCISMIGAASLAMKANATTPIRMLPSVKATPEDPEADPVGLISRYFNAMNAGDISKAAALFAPHAAIIDPFPPPHVWHSFAAWRAASIRVQAERHLTDFNVRVLEALTIGSSAFGNAYCDVPVIISFKKDGQPRTEKGIVAFTTARTRHGWRITGWSLSSIALDSFWNNFQGASAPPQ
jgi:hypothetical protein